jgi:hypothetical protein
VGSLLCSDLKEELDERLPTGALMSGEPVASAKDLQWYKGLLLEKQRELSSVQGDAGTRVPAAGCLEGDLIDQANADAEAELQIRLHQSDAPLLTSNRAGTRSDQAGYIRSVTDMQAVCL